MRYLWAATALVLASFVAAQDGPPPAAPVVPDDGADEQPGRRRIDPAAAREMMNRRVGLFEQAGLTREEVRKLFELMQPSMRAQHDLQLQLQSLTALLTNEETPDEEITAAVEAFEQLRDEALAERDGVYEAITNEFGDPPPPRLGAFLMMLGVTDNGLRMGAMGAGMGGRIGMRGAGGGREAGDWQRGLRNRRGRVGGRRNMQPDAPPPANEGADPPKPMAP